MARQVDGVGWAENVGAPLSRWPQDKVCRNACRNFVESALYRIGLIALEIGHSLELTTDIIDPNKVSSLYKYHLLI